MDNKEKLEKILKALDEISKEKVIFFPIHPRTKKRINEFGLEKYTNNFVVSEPIDYLRLMGLVRHSWKVITDSGGLQKEAYFGKKRCIVLMPVEKVLSEDNVVYPENLYGDGRTGEKIVKVLVN